MDDAGRLRARLARGALLHPVDPGTPSIVDFARALARWAGAPDVHADVRVAALAGAIEDAEHLVFVMVDGLGMRLIEGLPATSFLATHFAHELRTVYPSSTPPALTSLATGAWPGQHAVTGWWTYLPDAGVSATILPFVERFSERGLEGTVRSEYAFPYPALMPSYAVEAATYMPRSIADSAYSRYTGGGRAGHGYERIENATGAIVRRIETARSRTYSYLYVPVVDQAEHAYGPQDERVGAVVRGVERAVEQLAARLDGRARLALTADHGVLAVPDGKRHVLDRNDDLMAHLLVPPTGEPRAPYFHVRDGGHEAFAAAFRRPLGDRFALLTIEEAASSALFGPDGLSEEAQRRLGDFAAIALDDDVLLYEPADSLAALRGFHGGLHPDEMRIPLIIA